MIDSSRISIAPDCYVAYHIVGRSGKRYACSIDKPSIKTLLEEAKQGLLKHQGWIEKENDFSIKGSMIPHQDYTY